MNTISIISDSPEPQVEPPIDFAPLKSKLLIIVLQISHRLGAIALLCTLATWAMIYSQKSFNTPLAFAAGTAEGGLAFGLLGRVLAKPRSPTRREANGVTIFNLLFFLLAIYLMLLTRLDVIRDNASQFFSPSTPSPVENHW